VAVGTGNTPELTREQVVAILVQPLEQASVFLASGPRIFDTDGSPVRVPKLTGTTDPSWHAENELIDEADPDFGEVTLLPQTMKSVKVLTRFSNELARQSVIALDAALRDRLVRDVAAKIDIAFITGDGGTPAGAEPLGIINYPGTQELTGIGAPALDDLHDAVGLAMGANVDSSRLRWLMTSRDFVGVRKLKDLQDRYQVSRTQRRREPSASSASP
jgi:HK97 family phage major capsid protein